ncbi:MAG: GNAT family N-acetyltransferase [Hymenobacteraceae bacterium]|nr:GNAT family N-acetyltransferase [Hymenobacteraceae bacterium]
MLFPKAFPTIYTQRLLLRQFEEADAVALNRLRNDLHINEHLFFKRSEPLDKTLEVIQNLQNSFQSQTGISWAVTIPETQVPIGYVGFGKVVQEHQNSELGYLLLPNFWAQGIMTEALRAVMSYGFNKMKLRRVEAFVKPANMASILVLEKNGFEKEAHFKEYFHTNGTYTDCCLYARLSTPSAA